ncbi:MAG: alanine racemase [Chthoniobacteraceae bacterium]|nr:alanine racemase [Chthoniobacteraceae bacterium]
MSAIFSEPFRRCWAEIDLNALRHNVATIREHAGAGAGILAVVKANAYGHGVIELARELRYLVEMFGVASVAEALQLRRAAPDTPILVLGPALPEEREAMVRHGMIPVVSSLEEARAYDALAQSLKLAEPFPIHLKVDTGMGRIGVWHEEALAAARAMAALPGIRLAGVATHLPAADEDAAWTGAELAAWETFVRSLGEAGIEVPVVHALQSAGTILFHRQALVHDGADLIRPGLILYGCSPVPEFQARLRPVLAWKSRITLLREVPAGRTVSYGRTFVTPAPMRIATVCAGYADGYPRHLSNAGAQVLIGGRRCAVLGRVTMDQILVDADAVPEAAVGDEVVLIGRQGSEEIPVAELAEKSGTIPWEIFTGISSRVVRYYL